MQPNKKTLMGSFSIFISILFISASASAQNDKKTNITVHLDSMSVLINANIYGQFSEHLGSCIYGGIWVGEDSPIPNTRGIRNDVIEALKKLKVPVLRWPGGCFADEYHWKDGIGPREKRPKMVNTNWGGVVEDNSFGTHEFLDLCELIGAEPYISANLGSGTVQELADWIQYTTSNGDNPMANLRRQNGREKPWEVKYWGIGNESWGCGGRMRPEYYADLMRRYSTFAKNYSDNQIYKIAVGPNVDDTTWTRVVMQNGGNAFHGMALHYYTNNSRPAADFAEAGWFDVIKKTLRMEELIGMHSVIMDQYDPGKKIALIVDEWGTWHNVEPGTNPSFLYQQNTLRDALVAASNFNIFHKHADRVRMTNIAQMVNVLQAMILTNDEKMLLTPTFYVFEMFQKHQDAIHLPMEISAPDYRYQGEAIPAVNASASIDSKGLIHVSLANVDPNQAQKVSIAVRDFKNKIVRASLLTADKMNAMNTFDHPGQVVPTVFSEYKISGGILETTLPSKSVVMFELEGKIDSKIGAARKIDHPKPQLKYAYYQGVFMNLPDFADMQILREGLVGQFVMPPDHGGSDFAVKYSGYIKIPVDGFYNFYANSDDGARIYINDKLVVNNDGRHAPIEVKGFAVLNAGFHKIEAEFFQAGGGLAFDISIEGPGLEKQIIPAGMLFHSND